MWDDSIRRIAARLVWIALLVAVAGCRGLAPQTFVAGLPVGERVEADERFTNFALATLEEADPAHAEVVSTEAYAPDYRSPDGNLQILVTRSGGHDLIVVLRLADGAVHAFYIGCGVGVDTQRCFLGPPDIGGS